MAVRHGLLALLAEGPKHGFALRSEFETRTGGTWPLNVGQVYTTLSRLVRDGLAEEVSREADGSVIYDITEAGREEIERWWIAPVDRGHPNRDELAIKLALAVTVPGVDVRGVVQRQRSENLRVMQQYTQLKRSIANKENAGLAWRLVLDHLIFAAEAEARWLDHVDLELARENRHRESRHREGLHRDGPIRAGVNGENVHSQTGNGHTVNRPAAGGAEPGPAVPTPAVPTSGPPSSPSGSSSSTSESGEVAR